MTRSEIAMLLAAIERLIVEIEAFTERLGQEGDR